METIYYRRADGGLTAASGSSTPELPEGAKLLTEAQYNKELAVLVAANKKLSDALVAADEAKLADDIAVLTALGVPEDTARRMLRVPPKGE